MEICLNFSAVSDMGLANLPTLKEYRTFSNTFDLSDVTSSGMSAIPAMHLWKHGMPYSQSSDNAHSDASLHLGRRMRAAIVLILLHITVGSAPQLPGKACANSKLSSSSKYQLREPGLRGTQQNNSYFRYILN